MEQKKKIRIIIIVLAILLGLSLLALGGTLVYNKLANNTPATVTVPDNLITPGRGHDQARQQRGQQPSAGQLRYANIEQLRRDTHTKHNRRNPKSGDH